MRHIVGGIRFLARSIHQPRIDARVWVLFSGKVRPSHTHSVVEHAPPYLSVNSSTTSATSMSPAGSTLSIKATITASGKLDITSPRSCEEVGVSENLTACRGGAGVSAEEMCFAQQKAPAGPSEPSW